MQKIKKVGTAHAFPTLPAKIIQNCKESVTNDI